MRNVKLLWGIIVLLTGVGLVLFRIAITEPHASVPDPSASSGEESRIVAKIGDKVITSEMVRQKVYSKYGLEVLNQMVDHLAIQLEADDRGLRVEEKEIAAELTRMQQGYGSEEQFYQSMKEQVGMTREELHEDVYFKLLVEKAATSDIVVGENEISDYIKQNPEEFADTEQLHLQFILNETLEQANRTYQLATAGGDFATLARERSLDINTASEGGDLGWIEENDPFVSPNILKTAKELTVGEIGQPVQTESGYAVVKLLDRKEDKKSDPEAIRESVRKQLALQKAPAIKDYILALRDKWKASLIGADSEFGASPTPSPSPASGQ
ncbi:peptidylprolyl isomerase [Gorillibacterium timonense]|uniref:peptidylprolyl isomerase n=1 Tax=Gorillibacterium timonense TaxID=1689269 RepID=UPI00071D7D4E|nr:peptidylprolyl isomerase [Gorillibacterium timonense]